MNSSSSPSMGDRDQDGGDKRVMVWRMALAGRKMSYAQQHLLQYGLAQIEHLPAPGVRKMMALKALKPVLLECHAQQQVGILSRPLTGSELPTMKTAPGSG